MKIITVQSQTFVADPGSPAQAHWHAPGGGIVYAGIQTDGIQSFGITDSQFYVEADGTGAYVQVSNVNDLPPGTNWWTYCTLFLEDSGAADAECRTINVASPG